MTTHDTTIVETDVEDAEVDPATKLSEDTGVGAVLGGASGAVVGAVAGAVAGPAGAVVGAFVSGIAGAVGSGAAAYVDRLDNDDYMAGLGGGIDVRSDANRERLYGRLVPPGSGVEQSPASILGETLDRAKTSRDKSLGSVPDPVRLRLEQVFDPAYVDKWWNMPQKRFNGVSPSDIYKNGEWTTVEMALSRLEQGLPG